MTSSNIPIAGMSFAWEWISGHYLRVDSFVPFATVDGDNVGPATPLVGYGNINAELSNPDVEPDQRIVSLPIENKSDYKSIFRAHLDAGVQSGFNELIILYELRRGFFGRRKPGLHVAYYPAGTWLGFFDAVSKDASAEFRWPPPLCLYSPTGLGPFPAPTGGLTKNLFSP
jgi:hypothetical protein